MPELAKHARVRRKVRDSPRPRIQTRLKKIHRIHATETRAETSRGKKRVERIAHSQQCAPAGNRTVSDTKAGESGLGKTAEEEHTCARPEKSKAYQYRER
jgi:hypothetical protein